VEREGSFLRARFAISTVRLSLRRGPGGG